MLTHCSCVIISILNLTVSLAIEISQYYWSYSKTKKKRFTDFSLSLRHGVRLSGRSKEDENEYNII